MTRPTHRLEHIAATADDWGLSNPQDYGEDERRRPLVAVATDLNGRLKQCCRSADSPSAAASGARSLRLQGLMPGTDSRMRCGKSAAASAFCAASLTFERRRNSANGTARVSSRVS